MTNSTKQNINIIIVLGLTVSILIYLLLGNHKIIASIMQVIILILVIALLIELIYELYEYLRRKSLNEPTIYAGSHNAQTAYSWALSPRERMYRSRACVFGLAV